MAVARTRDQRVPYPPSRYSGMGVDQDGDQCAAFESENRMHVVRYRLLSFRGRSGTGLEIVVGSTLSLSRVLEGCHHEAFDSQHRKANNIGCHIDGIKKVAWPPDGCCDLHILAVSCLSFLSRPAVATRGYEASDMRWGRYFARPVLLLVRPSAGAFWASKSSTLFQWDPRTFPPVPHQSNPRIHACTLSWTCDSMITTALQFSPGSGIHAAAL